VVANVSFTVGAEIDTCQTPMHYQIMVFVSDLEKNESYLAGYEIKPFAPEEQAITNQISFSIDLPLLFVPLTKLI